MESSGVRVAAPVMSIAVPFETALTVKLAVLVVELMVALVGSMEIAVIIRNTVAVAVELKACALAVIVAVPVLTPVMIPVLGSTEATSGVSVDQETPLLIWLRVPSS